MADILPMIPVATPNIIQLDVLEVTRTMEDGWVSTVGPAVDKFEAAIAVASGVEHVTAVAAGTMGLHVALVACGVKRDDLVLCPSFSFIATANAISLAGASPFFVDVEPDSWCIAPNQLAEVLELACERDHNGAVRHCASGRRVAAIMPVYAMGTPADMDAIRAIAKNYELPVIADAAAAIGARYRDRPIGGLADLTIYSFNGNKTITTGGGGAVLGPDETLVSLVKHLSSTARSSSDYDHDQVGFNYRMTAIEAALGCSQIARLDEFLNAKRRIRMHYENAFEGTDLIPFPVPNWASSAYWFSGVLLPERASVSVANVCDSLRSDGIGVRQFWKPLHNQIPYRGALSGDLSLTEALWHRVLVLPCSTHITDGELARVEEAVRTHVVSQL